MTSQIDNNQIIYNKCGKCNLTPEQCELKSEPKIAGCIIGTYGELMKGEQS